MRASWILWAFAAALIACGDDGATTTGSSTTGVGAASASTASSGSAAGSTSSQGGGTGTGSASSASGTGGGGTGGGGPMGPCPISPPSDGSPCTVAGTACSWGSDARYGCRIAATCDGSQWTRFPPAGSWNCPMPEPACPASAPGDGTGCTDAELGLTCVYDHVAYTCANCNGNLCFQTNSWASTPLDPACPEKPLPNLGDPCQTPGVECDYDHCSDDQEMTHGWVHGVPMSCLNGVWNLFDPGFCP